MKWHDRVNSLETKRSNKEILKIGRGTFLEEAPAVLVQKNEFPE